MRKLARLLFSRYTVCALIIALELALFIFILMLAESFAALISVSTLLSVTALIHLMNKDVNPEYKTSWAVVILLLPYVGVTFYALFFRRRMTKREIRISREIQKRLPSSPRSSQALEELSLEKSTAYGKVRALLHDDKGAEVYSDTVSEYIGSGEEYFTRLLNDLASAQRAIYLEYFIIEKGVMWDTILSVLEEKARAGVDVRVLYDDIGCMKTLPWGYVKHLRSLGISASVFSRVTPKVTTVHNNRDHRKIAVIDFKVAYTGGVNLADEYIGAKIRFGHWKDGGVRVEGGAAYGFAKQFLSIWAYNLRSADEALIKEDDYSPALSDGGYYVPFGQGPVPLYDSPGKNLFLNLINQAREYIYVTTPYLVIDYELTEALCCAAERGVDVRLITPGIPDKKAVNVMTKSSYPHLLASGVRIFEYTPGFIHEKLFVSDDEFCVIGSINLDYRSLVHHFEDGLFIYSSPSVVGAKEGFLLTEEASSEITDKAYRLSVREWVIRILIKLFAPLL